MMQVQCDFVLVRIPSPSACILPTTACRVFIGCSSRQAGQRSHYEARLVSSASPGTVSMPRQSDNRCPMAQPQRNPTNWAAKLVLIILFGSLGDRNQQHAHCRGLRGLPDLCIHADGRCLRIRPVDVSHNCRRHCGTVCLFRLPLPHRHGFQHCHWNFNILIGIFGLLYGITCLCYVVTMHKFPLHKKRSKLEPVNQQGVSGKEVF